MTRILISAGGTGGGVYPALAVASALRRQAPDATLDFATSVHGLENDLLDDTPAMFDHWYRLPSGPLHGVNLLRKVVSALRIGLGTLWASVLLIRIRPDAIFMTGGWVGLPLALAAWLTRVPVVIFVPDVEPGRTLKLLGRFARLITATTPDTARFYPTGANVVATGYPLRDTLLETTREAGLQAFDLDPDKRTLLVFGGSRGSRAINNAVLKHLDALLAIPDLQILHVSGKLDAANVQQRRDALPNAVKSRYQVRAYVDDFGLALAAADLVVSRAGASTLGEFPVFGLPSILVPLAYEWHYQEVNADWLAERGAAIRLDEPDMDTALVPLVQELLTDETKYAEMQACAEQLSQRQGADNIARAILGVVKPA